MKTLFYILLIVCTSFCFAQNQQTYLKQSEIEADVMYLDSILQNKSSYQSLNGYDYKKDFNQFLIEARGKDVTIADFGLFLSKTIGKLGDRHAFIQGYDLPESLYLPMAFAPFKDKVLALKFHRDKKEYGYYNSDYPYLKAINNIPIEIILQQMLPEDVLAPKKSYLLNAVRDLRDIETVFSILDLKLPNPLSITLANEKGVRKKVTVDLVLRSKRPRLWDERFYKHTFRIRDEKYNDKNYIKRFFKTESNIGYIQIPDMVSKEDSPVFFDALKEYMLKAKDSEALIIDVRDNGGGTRDLIQELAGYFVHPDAVHVVNAVKQRGKLPLTNDLREGLNSRYLFSKDELDKSEKKAIDKFMSSFTPMYNLDSKKFSEYHYYVLNGAKLSKDKLYYNKPVYILANERSFSAASVLVSVFKGLANITIVGVNTDGSSGNSQRFKLPNSKLKGKISTMVSFQKNGKILDGIGTKPDIMIERNIEQIFFKEDYQLKKLKHIIKNSLSSK